MAADARLALLLLGGRRISVSRQPKFAQSDAITGRKRLF
jgi:hypothetical protein